MIFFEIIKTIVLGIVEGITEWLPISSTGHMILVDEFMKLDVRDGSSDTIINGIAFRQCAFYEPLRQNKPLAICYTLEDNKFNALQLMVRDIKLNEDAF